MLTYADVCSKGVVSLLCAQRYEEESDGQGGHIEAWMVHATYSVCPHTAVNVSSYCCKCVLILL